MLRFLLLLFVAGYLIRLFKRIFTIYFFKQSAGLNKRTDSDKIRKESRPVSWLFSENDTDIVDVPFEDLD